RLLLITTIRSDKYELLQSEPRLVGIKQDLFNLPPLPSAEFKSVIEGPAQASGRLAIDPEVTESLIADAQGADALPLLAFTIQRLYAEYGGGGRLTYDDLRAVGGVQGSIESALAQAVAKPNESPAIPINKEVQLALLRKAFIPFLARIDTVTG